MCPAHPESHHEALLGRGEGQGGTGVCVVFPTQVEKFGLPQVPVGWVKPWSRARARALLGDSLPPEVPTCVQLPGERQLCLLPRMPCSSPGQQGHPGVGCLL